jgi:HPt (histidine-containing phosphotransfer) domain-containing protein/HAMP domain-containing protein
MKNAVWMKILLFAVIPFIGIYGVVAVFISLSVFQDKIRQTEVDTRTLSRFNETNLRGYIENILLVTRIAAADMETINPENPEARKLGEQAILSSFENPHVFNAWLAFEPNAFDGKDAEHRGDYPGAPSGRYMRSYVRGEHGILVAPDMDEAELDNLEESDWYVGAKLTGRPYIDINSPYEIFYDYGIDETLRNLVSITCPLFRNGSFIGCVGADFLLDEVILGREIIPGAVSALFMSNGGLQYARDPGLLGKSIEELGFSDPPGIRAAFRRQIEFFLTNDDSVLIEGRAYSYFIPVQLEDFNDLVYLYAAIPETTLWETMYAVLRPIGIALIVSLILFSLLLFYLAHSISRPIHELTLASEAISQGDFGRKLMVSLSRDEIGAMTRSLHRMVEQFRMYIALQERSKELLDIYTRLHSALYQRDTIEDVFDATIFIIAGYFKVSLASLIVLKDGIPWVTARYSAEKGLWKAVGKSGATDFPHHNQVAALLDQKKYLSLNAYSMSQEKITFASKKTNALCILPINLEGSLRGYFILESAGVSGSFVHDDAALIFITDTISYILARKKARPPEDDEEAAYGKAAGAANAAAGANAAGKAAGANAAGKAATPRREFFVVNPEEAAAGEGASGEGAAESAAAEASARMAGGEERPLTQDARTVAGLNVDRGLLLIGNDEDQYGELLRISAKVFSEGIQKMRRQHREDIPGFAIEVHGMKGALYNIGAEALGDFAKKLELAAKAGEDAYCAEAYPEFEDRLAAFGTRLMEITGHAAEPAGAGSPPELPDLIEALQKALRAVKKFDAILAAKIIRPFTACTWDPAASPEAALRGIVEALDNIDYDEAEGLISGLLRHLEASGNGAG